MREARCEVQKSGRGVIEQSEDRAALASPRTYHIEKAAQYFKPGAVVRTFAAISCIGLLLVESCSWRGQKYQQFVTPTPLAQTDVLVLGFMGGRDAWNNEHVGVGRMAKRLRERNPDGVHVETVENRKRGLALELVRRALDRNGDGAIDPQERRSVRLILYGQSFGGAAVVKFAKQLKALDIPVALTVQVDSIGLGDEVIPPNVAAAANLFQHDGWFIKGPEIVRAEDPAATKIIGNFRFSYRHQSIDLAGVPWYKKFLRNDHTRMDFDPEVWKKVEELIVAAIQGKQGEAHHRDTEAQRLD